jgi:hypothetical protein
VSLLGWSLSAEDMLPPLSLYPSPSFLHEVTVQSKKHTFVTINKEFQLFIIHKGSSV